MPTIKINNEELTYNNIYHVEGINGNDTNDGSKENPLLTVTEAYNRCVNGDAIYLIGNENANYNDYTDAINKNIDFIGDGLNSVMDFGFSSRPWMYSSGNCDFYRLKIMANQLFRENGEEYYNFYNCILGLDLGGFIKQGGQNGYVFCYNCIFDNRGLSYGAFRQGKYYENCIAFGNCNDANDYGVSNLVNSYINDLFVEDGTASNQGTTYSYTVNTDYSIDGLDTENKGAGLNPDKTQAHIGVYGGPYAWGDWISVELVNLLFDPLHPFKDKDTSINITGTIKEKEDKNIDLRYRLTLNGNQLYPESPYPYSITEESTEDYISTATGYETPEGTISASSEYSGDWPAWHAFNDKNIERYDDWSSEDTSYPHWLSVHLNEGVVVNGYALTTRDSESSNTHAPKSWVFQGSDDGNEWVDLDLISDEDNWDFNEKRIYRFTNLGIYMHYRIKVTDSDSPSQIVSIGEMELFKKGETVGYTSLQTTPFNLDINLGLTDFNVGDNTLTLEVLDNNDTKMEILNKTITKYDRDTFTMNRNLNNDGSINILGDSIINNDGLSLSTTGKGSAVIEIPTEGKARILENSFNNVSGVSADTDHMSTATGYETPEGTISASSEYNGGQYPAWMAFDDSTEDKTNSWLNVSGEKPSWLMVQLNEPVIVFSYSLTSRSPSNSQAYPTDWTFEGSNDGSNWDVLHSVTNENGWSPSEKRTYGLDKRDLYNYYRIHITNSSDEFVGIGELELFKEATISDGITYETLHKTEPMEIREELDGGTVYQKTIDTTLNIKEVSIG